MDVADALHPLFDRVVARWAYGTRSGGAREDSLGWLLAAFE